MYFLPENVAKWVKKSYIRKMDTLAAYKVGINVLIPVFSALTCGALVALSQRDCRTEEECRLKKILLVYLSLSALGWYMTFCYEFHPGAFAWLHVLCLVGYVLPSLFFYRIVRYLTRVGEPERFSWLHFLLPGILTAVMLGWSLVVPISVQMEIVRGKATVFPEGYELYARFFTIKPLLRVIFGIAYYVLTIGVLVRYYGRSKGVCPPGRRTARWVVFLVGISIASLLSSLLPTFMPRLKILHSVWTLIAAAAIAFQHVLLSYHVIRRKYRLYTVQDEAEEAAEEMSVPSRREASAAAAAPVQPLPAAKPRRRHHRGKLERASFEAYFREQKPWLSPDCKIAALVEAFDVNRTVLSAFINRTYGVNFNRYVNGWRLRELERLRTLPANEDKSMRSLVGKAGFDNYRTYLRAMAAERQAAAEDMETAEIRGITEAGGVAGIADVAEAREAGGMTHTAETAETAEAAKTAGTAGTAGTAETAVIAGKAETAGTARTAGIAGTTDRAETMSTTDTINTMQAADRVETMSTLQAADMADTTDATGAGEVETGREKGGASW